MKPARSRRDRGGWLSWIIRQAANFAQREGFDRRKRSCLALDTTEFAPMKREFRCFGIHSLIV
ncbi:MAG: hypothetical protein WD969_16760 [Paracoccaceae bacterium]